MEYKQKDIKSFIENFRFFNENVVSEPVSRAYVSVGSNLFVQLGTEECQSMTNEYPNEIDAWTIWFGGSVGWRLTHHNQYIIDSSDSNEEANIQLQQLVHKKIVGCDVISQFMDLQFEFEDKYQLTCFFKTKLSKQWVLFCPNGDTIGLESENQELVNETIQLSKNFRITNLFKPISLPIVEKKLLGFSIDQNALYLDFEGSLSLYLDSCAWRIEHNNEYCVSSVDSFYDKAKEVARPFLNEIVDSKLIQGSITQPFKDARFEFENGYVIKTFSCYKSDEPWSILKNDKATVYSAHVSLTQ